MERRSSPNVGSDDNSLGSVIALSSTNVWAVGGHSDRQAAKTLVEHWNGTKWSIVPAPGGKEAFFAAVTAIDATHLWAVGRGRGGPSFGTLTERWNGNRWRIVKSPSPGYDNDILYGVAASGSHDVWAVGRDLNTHNNLFETLTEHWNGTSWQAVASPNQEDAAPQVSYDNYLNGVAMTSAHTAWAVGYYQPHNGYTGATLIEYYC